MKPVLLDLFCKAGGAGMGYHLAGFDVVGVDIEDQPRYPFEFYKADALQYLEQHGHLYDVIHASPPCQRYTNMQSIHKNRIEHPDLIEPVRDMLIATGKPFIIENVVGAPLKDYITLCGVMFGLKVYRHRLFESNVLLMEPPHPCHPEVMPSVGRGVSPSGYVSIGAGGIIGVRNAHKLRSDAMGIDWMNRDELTNAVPPAFTNYVGQQILNHLN